MDIISDLTDSLQQLAGNTSLVLLTALLTFLITLFAFYNQVAVPMYNKAIKPIVHFFKSVYDSPDHMEKLDKKLDSILAELKTNGGTSIKDQLNRLEEGFAIGEGQRLMLLNTMKDAVFLANPDGTNKWFNNAMLIMTGKDSEDLIGNSWVNAVYREDRDYVAKEWIRAITSLSNFDLTYRMYNAKTGEVFKVHTTATPIMNPRGRIVGYNGVVSRYPTEVIIEAAKVTIEKT